MAQYTKLQITNIGKNALANAQNGTELRFTKVKLGDGTASDISILTDLVRTVMTLQINSSSISNGVISIAALMDNTSLSTGFYIKEVGIFAIQNGQEFLYAYTKATNPDYVPEASAGPVSQQFNFKISVQSGANITFQISNEAVALKSDLTTLEQNINNSLSKKVENQTFTTEISEINGVIAAHSADDLQHVKYAPATGTANTYAVSFNPAPTAYVEGMAVAFKVPVASNAASTLNVNSLGAKGIKKANGTDVTNLKAGGIYTVRYDGTAFILQGEGGEYGTAQAVDVRSTKTFGTEDGVVQGSLDLTNLTPSNIKNGVVIDGVTGTLNPLEPGYNVVSNNATEKYTTVTSQMYKVKETRILIGGTFRVSFEANNSSTGWEGKAQIYVNGVARGILRSVTQNTYTTFHEDFTLNANDYIQVYAMSQNSSVQLRVRNLNININLPNSILS